MATGIVLAFLGLALFLRAITGKLPAQLLGTGTSRAPAPRSAPEQDRNGDDSALPGPGSSVPGDSFPGDLDRLPGELWDELQEVLP